MVVILIQCVEIGTHVLRQGYRPGLTFPFRLLGLGIEFVTIFMVWVYVFCGNRVMYYSLYLWRSHTIHVEILVPVLKNTIDGYMQQHMARKKCIQRLNYQIP